MSSTQSNIPKQPSKGSGDHDKPPESGAVSQVSLNLASTSHDDDHVGPKAESDSWSLPSHLSNHLNTQFSTFKKDNVLNENILDDHPIPDEHCLTAPQLDGYLDDLFEARDRSFEKKTDFSLQFIQKRMLNVMDPLSHLWGNLDKIRHREASPDLDIYELLDIVEKSVCLVGQANLSINFHRRLSILSKLVKDPKKAKKLLYKYEGTFADAKGKLFGDPFYNTLLAEVKRKQKARDILGGRHSAPKKRLISLETSLSRSSPFMESPQVNQVVLDKEIGNMMMKGAIEEILPGVNLEDSQSQFLSPMFVVPKKDGGQRPILNMKKLNAFIPYNHFKMESLSLLKDVIQENAYMCKLDLKDAYFSIPIARHQRKFLRFQWKGRLFQFLCLPFGLAPAPRTFTKLLKPVVSIARRAGIRLIIYLDDMILFAHSPESLVRCRESLLYLLKNLGFIINKEKSVLVPCQNLNFLGFEIDSQCLTLTLPQKKVTDILQRCHRILKLPVVKIRTLATLLGKLSASMRAIVPAQLHCRFLQMQSSRELLEHQSYEHRIKLSRKCVQEIHWWVDNLSTFNGKPISAIHPDLILQTDATNLGWGAVCNQDRTGGRWSLEESKFHINALELKAVLLALQCFCKSQSGMSLLVQVDNRTAVSYVNRQGGTKSHVLDTIAKEIWDFCLQRKITLEAQYLPGKENIIADWESRHFADSSEWLLNRKVFNQCNQRLGPHLIDLFASRLSHQLEKYVSWRPDPQATYIDAFRLEWKGARGYAFPPFSMIGRCLWKVRRERAELTLITPVWQGQAWYPVLLEMSVECPILLPVWADLLESPQGQTHPLVALLLAAWRVSGIWSLQEAFRKKLPSFCHTSGDQGRKELIIPPGRGGLAGVWNGKSIPFLPLWNIS
ncbi:uncharacterized protein LOC125384396 [Haliotis rufescens]|uniref:uncharacterized protein LOC125384396 n=1 Tax=Haliotis rufescens TaxID=6454 RepID=UPI00201EF1AD|nr:uncharacterized protein LOC125384396 [Haliotis rufescens]